MARFHRDINLKYSDILREKINFDNKPIIVDVERANSASQSVMRFFNSLFDKNLPKCDATTMESVGMRIDNRSSIYDLWWFKTDPNIVYAIDKRDRDFVCICTIRE